MAEQQYIKARLIDQIQWYNKKSKNNQYWYKFFQIAKIVLAVSIPVLSILIEQDLLLKVIISVNGALIAIIESITKLNSHRDLWIAYRLVSETLKREKIFFESQVAPYDVVDPLDLLITRCERIMSAENLSWLKLQDEKDMK